MAKFIVHIKNTVLKVDNKDILLDGLECGDNKIRLVFKLVTKIQQNCESLVLLKYYSTRWLIREFKDVLIVMYLINGNNEVIP